MKVAHQGPPQPDREQLVGARSIPAPGDAANPCPPASPSRLVFRGVPANHKRKPSVFVFE
jgi:hypothetical protein